MAVSATVQAGKIFSDGETVTISELNKLGTPTVDISGAVGTLTLTDGSVTNVKVASSAGIQLSKLETGSDAQVAVANSSGELALVTMTGDVTTTNAGVTSIGTDKVTTTKVLDANITEEKLAAAVAAKLTPSGVIAPYGAATAPSGWLLCDGGHYDSTGTYSDLYAVLAYVYGRTDSSGVASETGTYFKVPDLRGRVPLGLDGTAGRVASDDAMGESGGAETATLVTANLPSHSHGVSISQGTSGNIWTNGYNSSYGRSVNIAYSDPETGSYPYQSAQAVSAISSVLSASSDNVGSGSAFNKMSPYQVIQYIIKT